MVMFISFIFIVIFFVEFTELNSIRPQKYTFSLNIKRNRRIIPTGIVFLFPSDAKDK